MQVDSYGTKYKNRIKIFSYEDLKGDIFFFYHIKNHK